MSRIILFALNFIRRDIWLMDTARIDSHETKLRLYSTSTVFECSAIQRGELFNLGLFFDYGHIDLSLIPILAFSFSILKGFGGHKSIHSQFIEPSLDRWLGERDAPELRNLANQIVGFVEDTDLSSLGVAGFGCGVIFCYSLARFCGVCL